MTGKSEELQAELKKLHDILAEPGQLDPDTVTALRQAADDIRKALEASGQARSGPVAELRQQIDQLALQFESDHPQLARVLTQVTDLLSSLGI